MMQIKLGEKIKSLRKGKNISQEVLAQYLDVTFGGRRYVHPACEQKKLAAEMLVDMFLRLAHYYKETGQKEEKRGPLGRALRALFQC